VRRLLLLVSAIVFVDTMFYAAVTPLLPHLAREFALSKSEAGILAGSYAAGTLAGALPGGWLAARLGVRPTVLLGLGLMSVSSLGFALAGNPTVLDGCRFVQGVGGAASWAGSLAWLIGAAPRERRAS
jgi:MFS family permease